MPSHGRTGMGRTIGMRTGIWITHRCGWDTSRRTWTRGNSSGWKWPSREWASTSGITSPDVYRYVAIASTGASFPGKGYGSGTREPGDGTPSQEGHAQKGHDYGGRI